MQRCHRISFGQCLTAYFVTHFNFVSVFIPFLHSRGRGTARPTNRPTTRPGDRPTERMPGHSSSLQFAARPMLKPSRAFSVRPSKTLRFVEERRHIAGTRTTSSNNKMGQALVLDLLVETSVASLEIPKRTRNRRRWRRQRRTMADQWRR